MIRKPTRKEAIAPFELTCGKCGGAATAYPRPFPGVVVCPVCSPVWLKSFAEWSTQQVTEGVTP